MQRPFRQREGRDLQDPTRTWDLLRVVRMGAKEEGRWARREEFGEDVRRSLWRASLARALGTVAPGTDADYFRKVAYDRARLARRARDEGLAKSADLAAALRRTRREARLDRALRELTAGVEPAEREVAERVRARTAAWTRPQRVASTRLFFSDVGGYRWFVAIR